MSSQQQAKVQLQVNDLDVHKELQDERMRDMEGIADDMEHIQEMSKGVQQSKRTLATSPVCL